ncbi:hypothetical protein N7495_009260 [Penicillium taxi]|uniref:uncharacterized protein n=1 Tax=Penicillium taxi TaxID=168475 RepID=UPI002545A586|nr:uncharacterized protein N7495_009260 [Penicillium taxi]KAJ5884750.1 hypothetical protein N7495_009260 [Penicillium taxi]
MAYNKYKKSNKNSNILFEWLKMSGYALKITAGRTRFLISEDWETDENTCELTHVLIQVHLDFLATIYDVKADGRHIYFVDRGDSGLNWADWENDKYTFLGEISERATEPMIQSAGKIIAANMNKKGYNILTNNCRDFVNKLYTVIKTL